MMIPEPVVAFLAVWGVIRLSKDIVDFFVWIYGR